VVAERHPQPGLVQLAELIDATRSWKHPRQARWNNERFPPTVKPHADDAARVDARWAEYGLDDL